MKMISLKKHLEKFMDKTLAKNTGWMMLAQVFRLGLQAIYFVIIARLLGAEQYGAFVGVVALAGILKPFAGLGTGILLIKNVSRNRSIFGQYWGNSLFITFVTGLGLLILALLIQIVFLPDSISIWVLVLVGLSDLILATIIDTAARAFQAIEKLSRTSIISTLLFIVRAVAALIMLQAFPSPTAVTWATLYFASTFVTATIAIILVNRYLGRPRLALSLMKDEMSEGFFLAVSQSGQNINNNLDKVMLTSLASLVAAGIYGAAYRLIDVAMAPTRSLLYAAYARFFKHGETGIGGSLTVARRLLPMSIVYGLLATVGLIVLAPVVPLILGDEYTAAISALRWLAPLPLLKGVHFLASDTLTGSGHQKMRSVMILLAALFNAGLNLWLIPLYSWQGAAWSSLASDGFLVVSLWTLVIFYYGKSQQSTPILEQNTQLGNEL